MFPNKAAITLGIIILAAMGFDWFYTGGETLLFLARNFVRLIEWLAFWR
ncbi:MAG: hypothetical protein AAFR98_12720 [Pseudomonadota bacterium]